MNYRSVLTDEDLSALRERNQARLEAAQKALGTHWLLSKFRAAARLPETARSYQESAIAEHRSMQIRRVR